MQSEAAPDTPGEVSQDDPFLPLPEGPSEDAADLAAWQRAERRRQKDLERTQREGNWSIRRARHLSDVSRSLSVKPGSGCARCGVVAIVACYGCDTGRTLLCGKCSNSCGASHRQARVDPDGVISASGLDRVRTVSIAACGGCGTDVTHLEDAGCAVVRVIGVESIYDVQVRLWTCACCETSVGLEPAAFECVPMDAVRDITWIERAAAVPLLRVGKLAGGANTTPSQTSPREAPGLGIISYFRATCPRGIGEGAARRLSSVGFERAQACRELV